MLPLCLVLFIFYNFYYKRDFKRPDVNFIKNIRFVQMSMGQASDGIDLAYEFVDDFMYWRKPEKSLLLMKGAVQVSLVMGAVLWVVPLPYLIVGGLWAMVLSNS